jgi:hypothetical protein
VFALHAAQRYHEAIALLQAERADHPEHAAPIVFWLGCLYAESGLQCE